jgi:hypothetical protein
VKLEDVKIGMKVTCPESHSGFEAFPKWTHRMDGALGTEMDVVAIGLGSVVCASDIGEYYYLPEWLEPYKGKESDT